MPMATSSGTGSSEAWPFMMAAHLGDLGRVGRLGGEEFACLCFDVPTNELTRRLQAFRLSLFGTSHRVAGTEVSVTVSGGVAVRRDGQDFETLYAAADRALYAAKNAGRNRILIEEAAGYRELGGDPDATRPASERTGTQAA